MKQESFLQDQWIDIIIPPPPPSETLFWWFLSLTLFLVIGAIIVFFWQKQPHKTAQRKIKKLSKQIHHKQANNKALLKQLERILCHRFAVPHLSQTVLEDSHWSHFRDQLNQACYQARTPTDKQTQQLMTEAGLFTHKSVRT